MELKNNEDISQYSEIIISFCYYNFYKSINLSANLLRNHLVGDIVVLT